MNFMLGLGGKFARARKSALGSMGFYFQGRVQKVLRSGGGGQWHRAAAMTPGWWHRQPGKWKKRGTYQGPGAKLASAIRYGMDSQAFKMRVLFAYKRKPGPDEEEKTLKRLAFRLQIGRREKVTPKMRRFFGAMRRSKKNVPGQDIFPLGKDTKEIFMPKRPLILPVFEKEQGRAITVFRNKFYEALRRYGVI